MIDPFIDQLVLDLKPAKPLRNWMFAILCAFGGVAVFAWVFATLGIRADFADAMANGTMFWKSGALLIALIGALILVFTLSRPNNNSRIFHMIPFAIVFLIVAAQFYLQIPVSNLGHEITHTNFGGWASCLSIIVIGGVAILGAIWQFWIKNTASNRPILLGFAAGILSGAISAFAYSFHCNMDGAIYYLTCYIIPITAIGAIGAAFGTRLKW